MFSVQSFRDEIETLGLKRGDHVAVGISFLNLREFDGGPDVIVDTLLQIVGITGTLVANSYTNLSHLGTWNLRQVAEKSEWDVFDINNSYCNTGIIPMVMLERPDSIRSSHPTNSIVAIGNAAKLLTESHNRDAPAYSPYSELAKLGGKILSVGIGKSLVGVQHEAQFRAGLLSVIPPYAGSQYRDSDGQVRRFIRKDKGGCTYRFPELLDPLLKDGLIKEGSVGNNRIVLLAKASDVLDRMTILLKNDPAANLCPIVDCLWCREIERRLGLHHVSPLSLRDRLARSVISLMNWHRLKSPRTPRGVQYFWKFAKHLSNTYE